VKSLYFIDRSKKPRKISLFLAKPDKTVIGKIADASNKNQTVKFGQINELSFTIPYEITINNKLVRNPLVDKIKERFLIKAKVGDKIEWYIITQKSKSSSDSDQLNIQCFSLPYELKYKRIRDYSVTSYNCLQVMTDCLQGTGWKVGYINPEFNLMYRQFDVSSQTRLDFLFDICETFKAIPQFDTENRIVNLYKEEEVSVYKGFRISYGKYLQSIEETIDIDEVCTRLWVYGNEGISINSVNPTGQSYIDDFSYFMYPFQRDANRNVISHSEFMSDELCHAILDYNALVESKKDEFSSYLNTKKTLEEDLTTKNNELQTLNTELQMILDEIVVAEQTGQNTTQLIQNRDNKQNEINAKKAEIDNINAQIISIDNSINELKELLKIENNFTPELLEELNRFVFEDEWVDENYTNEDDLYNAAIDKIKEKNTPPINVNLDIVNFFEILEEQHNWDRLNLGDIIRVKYDKLGIDIQTKIIEMQFDYENGTIGLTISNSKKVESLIEKWKKSLYTIQRTKKELQNRKINWDTVAKNFNLRNDRNSTTPTNPTIKNDGTAISHTENDDGSVNLIIEWSYPNYQDTKKDSDDIDGFLIYLYSSKNNTPYVFGSSLASEAIVNVDSSKRKYMFPSVPPNLYYTIGVQAYRHVDTDINSDGILKSEIVKSTHPSEDPYIPKTTVDIMGNLNGKVNGTSYISSPTPPSNPSTNDVWFDTSTGKTNIFDGTQWQVTSAGNADMVAGFVPDVNNTANTIAVRDENGVINASISGDAQTLGGKSINDIVLKTEKGVANGVATLDNTGNIPLNQLSNITMKVAFGSYVGDGTQGRTINIGFKPTFVRVYTTKNDDFSVYITSESGGFAIKNNGTFYYLEGTGSSLNQESDIYGKISANGFITGSSANTYINKLNVKYYWEAYRV
jgi:phage minor structural protein